MKDFLGILILGHITGVEDIGHQKDGELGGDDVAVVQMDKGGKEHDLITERVKFRLVLGCKQHGPCLFFMGLLEQEGHILRIPADTDAEHKAPGTRPSYGSYPHNPWT